MGAANDQYAAVASGGRICSPAAHRARRLPLVAVAIALSAILAGCSHAPSSNYTAAVQPQPQAQRLAASPDPAVAAAQPAPPPDEYEQALISAYPSESLVDIVRGLQNPAPVQTAGPPPQAVGVPAPMAGQPLVLNSTATIPPAAMAGQSHPGAQPGSAPAVASAPPQAPGSAPAAAATAPPTPQPNEYDQALTAAYPSVTLGDFFRSMADPASH